MTFHLAVALDGTGWHPASWREPGARADELLTAGFWVDQVREAEAGLADLVTFEDSFALPGSERADRVQGRVDAVDDRPARRARHLATSGWCRR